MADHVLRRHQVLTLCIEEPLAFLGLHEEVRRRHAKCSDHLCELDFFTVLSLDISARHEMFCFEEIPHLWNNVSGLGICDPDAEWRSSPSFQHSKYPLVSSKPYPAGLRELYKDQA